MSLLPRSAAGICSRFRISSCAEGLSKTTIDGAISALSALFRDAQELEYVEENPAHRLNVRANDPRLEPARAIKARRASRSPRYRRELLAPHS
jgi:hypothetical protein